MKILLPCLLVLLVACETQTRDEKENFITPFEVSKGIETATYEETIEFYKELAREFPEINIQTIGETDSGYPLHLVTFNPDADFNFQKLDTTKTIVFINNGIHPGESDGIDATMMLFRDLAQVELNSPDKTVVVTVPVYNVGGAMNRNGNTRVNQNGPKSYGFRGNALNYDLNRDFIKCDTKNAKTFTQIFQLVQPDIFIDNHVSNGADYQYTLSHLFTQHNKLGGALADFLENQMIPQLENAMEEAGWLVTPYVYLYNTPPDEGFKQFMDHPRYSTGYAALWNSFSLMIETHMLKPYDQRVAATYDFLVNTISLAQTEHKLIKTIREEAISRNLDRDYYPLRWKLDSTRTRTLQFRGFEVDTILSDITGLDRLKYNRALPYTKDIPYYNQYVAVDSVKIPQAYIVAKEWQSVIELLDLNGISYTQLEKDSLIHVESYRIDEYQTSPLPYEGHYPHFDTKVSSTTRDVQFTEGDYVIPTDQPGIRYLLETLEPEALDSFFNWNFFDTVLQQKEGFSPYVFEDLAHSILESNRVLKDSFLSRKEADETFRLDWHAQLQWIYERSEFYESVHMQYPVYRILKNKDSNLAQTSVAK